MKTYNSVGPGLLTLALAYGSLCSEAWAVDGSELASALTPRPQQLTLGEGNLLLRGASLAVGLPPGPEHEACRSVLTTAIQSVGATIRQTDAKPAGNSFVIGEGAELPPLPTEGDAEEGYVLSVTPRGVTAAGASAAGLLYAAQTFRQLVRISSEEGRIPCLTVSDYPEFRVRGLYIEGGQERYGRIVDKDYLLVQIRRLAEFKMNVLIIECYNLFPYPSFPACADAGTLSREACQEIVAESKRYHVTLVPSLQTLAQAYELVWTKDEGAPYREPTAPGLMCPSNPDIYPFIQGLYRDLLTLFDASPLMGIGCSEIDMQWQGRYCPKCKARVDAGETVRDLLLGHAEKCIEAILELSSEMGRRIRPLMWGDEFYMYGPGKDWVGIERIRKDVVMGYWKYWQDYKGIGGLLGRGYDVLGISAMYNHTFYLADLSPDDPPKSWTPMEQTGVRNITEMIQEAERARRAHPEREFWGSATASFSKHRLRAFDSIWYGFVLNGHCAWRHPERPLDSFQNAFTRAFVRHYYDVRTDQAADALASVYVRLDRCKSQLELANQTLHDVVGVYDTQEAGYQGNTLLDACGRCVERINTRGEPDENLTKIREAAVQITAEVADLTKILDASRPQVGRLAELAYLRLAAEKIAAHAEREILMIDTQTALARAPGLPVDRARRQMDAEAKRWSAHRKRVERILHRISALYSKGDPCGFAALLRDIAAIETHLSHLAESGVAAEPVGGEAVLLREPFELLDPARWIILGQPRVADGRLETRAPGGWEHYCGIVSREKFALEDDRPLVIELDLTPLEMGVDSQLLASATDSGDVSYRFSFYGPRNRFGIYTQSSAEVGSDWVDNSTGWRLRALSPAIQVASTYHIRAELTRRTWRIIVHRPGRGGWELPLWDTGAAPMDELNETRLMFSDVEPENGVGASRWGPITVWRAERAR